MAILVTGGTGYIGSHTVVQLIESGYEVVIVDNFSNSKPEVLNRIEKITGVKPKFYKASILDAKALSLIFEENTITDVIHFAGLKSVAESVQKPKLYYENNVHGTEVLIEVMKEYGIKNLIFSSSATVYGVPKSIPLKESDPVGGCTNPYGQTKLTIEKMLMKYAKFNKGVSVVILRYFNPIGAHSSGLIGEDPKGIPNNLMPYITQVACKKLDHLNVYGIDYKTDDGTGVRDYIHVVDLAYGHLCALRKIGKRPTGVLIYNLGTGRGTSVLELIHAFESVNKLTIPYFVCARRPGDVDANYANAEKAAKELGFKCKLSIEDACRDSWNWQKNNPNGYGD